MKKSKIITIVLCIFLIVLVAILGMLSFFINGTKNLLPNVAETADYKQEGENIYISSVAELRKFRDDVNKGLHTKSKVYLTADIDFSKENDKSWTPIKNFQGTFNGLGHYISYFNINYTDNRGEAIGLFSTTNGATITNLGIKSATIKTTSTNGGAGAIVGNATNTNIECCYNESSTVSAHESAGGLVGIGNGVTIKSCFNKGKVSLIVESTDGAGGIIGQTQGKSSVISYCYNTENIKGIISGGIAGLTLNNTNIKYCYNVGKVESNQMSDEAKQGGISPSSFDHKTNCFYLVGTGNQFNATLKTEVEMKKEEFIKNLSSTFWIYKPNNYPKLKWEENTKIYINNKNELDNFRNQVNNGENKNVNAYLMADIDYNNEAWTPIKDFRGIFDGCGHVISKLNVNIYDKAGFFTDINEATIKNLGIENSTITGHDDPGGIVGDSVDSLIEKCYTSNCTIKGEGSVGGIAGHISRTFISECYNGSTIKNSGDGAQGGIAGNSDGDNNIEWCYNKGTVEGNDTAGGIISTSKNNDIIAYCYNVGKVTINETENGAAISNNMNALKDDCYYLAELGEDDEADEKTEQEMKQDSFISLIGGNQYWGFEATSDYGYPQLKWEKDKVKPTITLNGINNKGYTNNTVTINVKDRFSGVSAQNAFKLYKKNGNDYKEDKSYSNNAIISKEGQYYVIGYDESGNESEQKYFNIDKTPPQIENVKNGEWYDEAKTVTVSDNMGLDDNGLQWAEQSSKREDYTNVNDLNGSNAETTSNTFSTDGYKYIGAIDKAGNSSGVIWFGIDTTAPEKPIIKVNNQDVTGNNENDYKWHDENVEFSYTYTEDTLSGINSHELCIDELTDTWDEFWVGDGNYKNTSKWKEGQQYKVYSEVYNNANSLTVSDFYYFKIDNQAPSNAKPTVTKQSNTDVKVEMNQTDTQTGSGISKKEYGYCKKGTQNWNWSENSTITGLESGQTYEIKTRATDNVGHKTESISETITISEEDVLVAPTITAENYISGTWTNQEVTLTISGGSITSGNKKYQYKINTDDWKDYNEEEKIVLSEDGEYLILAKLADDDKEIETSEPFEVNIDTIQPSDLDILVRGTLEEDYWYGSEVNISVDALDDYGSGVKSLKCQLLDEGGEVLKENTHIRDDYKDTSDYGKNILTIEESGKYKIKLIATDYAGNESQREYDELVKVDVDELEVESVTCNPEEWTNESAKITINFQSVSGLYEVVIRKDDSDTEPIEGVEWEGNTCTFTAEENGEYIVAATSNSNSQIYDYSIYVTKIDKIAPEEPKITIEGEIVEGEDRYHTTVTVNFEAGIDNESEYTNYWSIENWTGTEYEDVGFGSAYEDTASTEILEDGRYQAVAEVFDGAKNRTIVTKEFIIETEESSLKAPTLKATKNKNTNPEEYVPGTWSNTNDIYIETENPDSELYYYYSTDKATWTEMDNIGSTSEGGELYFKDSGLKSNGGKLYFKSQNRKGEDSEIIEFEIKIDTELPKTPEITLEGTLEEEVYTSPVSVTIKSTEPENNGSGKNTFKYEIKNENGDTISEGSEVPSEKIKVNKNGTYTVTVKETDNAGNEATATKEFTININEYFLVNNYLKEEKYISKILPETTYENFKTNIDTNMDYVVKENGTEISDENLIKTGQEITVTSKITGESTSYILIVIGDINKDGKLSITDLSNFRRYRINKVEFDEEQKKASDMNFNGEEELTDKQRMQNYIIGKLTSLL